MHRPVSEPTVLHQNASSAATPCCGPTMHRRSAEPSSNCHSLRAPPDASPGPRGLPLSSAVRHGPAAGGRGLEPVFPPVRVVGPEGWLPPPLALRPCRPSDCSIAGPLLPLPDCHQGVYARRSLSLGPPKAGPDGRAMERVGVRGPLRKLKFATQSLCKGPPHPPTPTTPPTPTPPTTPH